MKITLVKKILADGSPCPKCGDVINKLEKGGFMNRIDDVVIADERDKGSQGMQLAEQHQVERAPFFIVETDGKDPIIYTVYMKFVKEVLEQPVSESEELSEIMRDNQDLDFI